MNKKLPKVTTRKRSKSTLHAVSRGTISGQTILQKLQSELKLNQSFLNILVGALIVIVAGILVFSYFKKGQEQLGPAQNTSEQAQKDVEPQNLPGKYTIKDGDTLFDIAQHYYKDGYQFGIIAQTNKLADVNVITPGQVLDIPKLPEGIGGATNETIWGEKISGDTYTVVDGDWLSKIAGRAYGDIMAFDKIAKANNISNPDLIEPGTVLKIPR